MVKKLRSDANDLAGTLTKVRILGCPARDEADELALHMFRQLLDSSRYEVEVISNALLASEVVPLITEKTPAMIFIATVSPGGLAQTRYLCKRLRAVFPNLKIAVGRWGMGSEESDSIVRAGADQGRDDNDRVARADDSIVPNRRSFGSSVRVHRSRQVLMPKRRFAPRLPA